jgi:hypothetical protein
MPPQVEKWSTVMIFSQSQIQCHMDSYNISSILCFLYFILFLKHTMIPQSSNFSTNICGCHVVIKKCFPLSFLLDCSYLHYNIRNKIIEYFTRLSLEAQISPSSLMQGFSVLIAGTDTKTFLADAYPVLY